uniref:transposase n=1 Tax=uncultured Desulfovibrio sp. TaxID=167968 RepID=UPI00345C27F9
MGITNEQWERLAPLLPDSPRGPGGQGGPVLNELLWIPRTGALRKDLPERYPPCQSCCGWFQRWRKKSVSGGCVVDKTRRGKGAKIMAAADAVGFPPALHVASASPHEATLQMKERVLYRVPRALQGSLSQLRCSLRFFFEGMTASIPCFSARARILSVSRPLSAKSLSAANPSI